MTVGHEDDVREVRVQELARDKEAGADAVLVARFNPGHGAAPREPFDVPGQREVPVVAEDLLEPGLRQLLEPLRADLPWCHLHNSAALPEQLRPQLG